ncbi:hypothetical protein GCM10027059_27930 [Myceligenerans halotolerans]
MAESPGPLLRAAREAAGITLRTMAARTHYNAGYLSLIENGERPVPAGVADAYQRVLGTTDLGRLVTVTRSAASVDAATLDQVATMLGALRRIEDTTGVLSVLPAVRGMSATVDQLAREASTPVRERAVHLAAEVTQYRGWLEHAVGADTAARRSMAAAVDLAGEAGEPNRLAHALTFAATVTWSATGALAETIDLSDAALSVDGAHPTLRAYAALRRSELLASLDQTTEARGVLSMADEAIEAARDAEPPPEALYWFTPGFGAVQRGAVLTLLGDTAQAIEEATAGLAEMPPEHRRTEWLASTLRKIDPDMTDA